MFEARDHEEIRAAVAKLCERFPGDYWRKLDASRSYPAELVAALTEAGYLATLIPEQYGGAGLTLSATAAVLEEIHRAGCNGAACHAQMYVRGTLVRQQRGSEGALPAADRFR
jgi:alkylation response protein AidB-like acyl-CoA dehydrogenase